MFPADFISGSRDFTQHLTSGEQGRLLFAHARESKKLFLLCHFRECIAGARGIWSCGI